MWRYTLRNGGWNKVPFQPNGRPASSTDTRTWSSFDNVVSAYETGRFSGIGISLDGQPDDQGLVLAAVDIDKAVGDTDQADRASDIIRRLDSYTELSPSGTGYRIFTRARPLRSGLNSGGIELYTSGRYLTVTGHAIHRAQHV